MTSKFIRLPDSGLIIDINKMAVLGPTNVIGQYQMVMQNVAAIIPISAIDHEAISTAAEIQIIRRDIDK